MDVHTLLICWLSQFRERERDGEKEREMEREKERERERETIPWNTLFSLFTRFADLIEINGDRYQHVNWPRCLGSLGSHVIFESRLLNSLFWVSLAQTCVQISISLNLGIATTNIKLSGDTQHKLYNKCNHFLEVMLFYQFAKIHLVAILVL